MTVYFYSHEGRLIPAACEELARAFAKALGGEVYQAETSHFVLVQE